MEFKNCVLLFIFLLIFSWSEGKTTSDLKEQKKTAYDLKIAKLIQNSIKAPNIQKHLRELTKYPHVAGRHRDEVVLASYVSNHFKAQGLEVEEHPYNVLLSYPVKDDLNYVAILHEGEEILKSQLYEKKFHYKTDPQKQMDPPYNPYSASGNVSGDLVFVNYGRINDFNMMKDLGVDVKGKICMVKYGVNYGSDKVFHGERFGCIGMIYYSDPKDYVIGDKVYPETVYMPGGAVQRITLSRLMLGDVETPSYPSISTAYRMQNNDWMPNIPVHPIGYDDAIKYLSKLGGNEVPEAWKGGLNITYRLGPGFAGEYKNSKMFLHVNVTRERRITKNIIGYIRGSVEPDRYVVIGNHRDAFGFGGIDPSSGTSVLLEVSRAFGVALKRGWKPRRTIILGNWGAEEFSLIGSSEWVEEFQKVLQFRAVAHLNLDGAADGSTAFGLLAAPDLLHTFTMATQFTPDPLNASISVYDRWLAYYPALFKPLYSYPLHLVPGVGSDHAPFIQICGISSAFFAYTYDRTGIEGTLKSYPAYHTGYETFQLIKNFIDPDFTNFVAMGRVWAEATRLLADSEILPLRPIDYADKTTLEIGRFLERYEALLKDHNIEVDLLKNATEEFQEVAKSFEDRRQAVDKDNALLLRAYNDQAMQLNRAFIDYNRISKENRNRHALFSPSLYNEYAETTLPGLYDSLFNIEKENTEERWDKVKRQYSVFLYHLASATSTLRDFAPLKGFSNVHPFV